MSPEEVNEGPAAAAHAWRMHGAGRRLHSKHAMSLEHFTSGHRVDARWEPAMVGNLAQRFATDHVFILARRPM